MVGNDGLKILKFETPSVLENLVPVENCRPTPAGTQRPEDVIEDVPLWSYFGRDVPDHNRPK